MKQVDQNKVVGRDEATGFIKLVFLDDESGNVVTLGGMGFMSHGEGDQAWRNVPEFKGGSSFIADRCDAQGDIVEERCVSAETCEQLTGRRIDVLIREGRAKVLEAMSGSAASDERQLGEVR
jgi:hypothetical protein